MSTPEVPRGGGPIDDGDAGAPVDSGPDDTTANDRGDAVPSPSQEPEAR